MELLDEYDLVVTGSETLVARYKHRSTKNDATSDPLVPPSVSVLPKRQKEKACSSKDEGEVHIHIYNYASSRFHSFEGVPPYLRSVDGTPSSASSYTISCFGSAALLGSSSKLVVASLEIPIRSRITWLPLTTSH